MENKTSGIKYVIVLIIAVVIATIITVAAVSDWPQGRVVLGEEYSFEDDYNLYIEYADEYVKTWDKSFVKDDNIKITSDINNGFVKIIVEGEISKIEARYPIKVKLKEEKNETIISYSNGIYEEVKKLPSEFDVHLIIDLYFFVTTLISYIYVYIIVSVICLIIKNIKEKIYVNMKQKEENNNK